MYTVVAVFVCELLKVVASTDDLMSLATCGRRQ